MACLSVCTCVIATERYHKHQGYEGARLHSISSPIKIVLFLLLLFFFWRQKADMPTSKHKRQLTTWQALYQVQRRFHSRELNANLFLESWVYLHHHPVVYGCLEVWRRFHNQESNANLLPWDLGMSPPSSSHLRSFRSSKTIFKVAQIGNPWGSHSTFHKDDHMQLPSKKDRQDDRHEGSCL